MSSHKRLIAQAFDALPAAKLKTATEYELDIALRDLRKTLETDKGTSDIDFYDDTLKPQWQSDGDKVTPPPLRPCVAAKLESSPLDLD